MVGIVGYGAYMPRYRIKVEEIAKVWGADAPSYKRGLMLEEKSVPAPDQDTITMSVEATKKALKRAGIDAIDIGAVYVGSESHPYAVKPSGTVVAEAVGATPEIHCADYEFACKAGSEAMFVCIGLVESGRIKYGLAVGADTSQGAPGDALEYAACEPAYFKHITGCAKGIMAKVGAKPEDFDYAVFHQPNGKFPMRVGKMLGFKKEQIETGWLCPWLGNTYSGSSPMGLTAILDEAKPGKRILMVSYGSGAGSDGFIFKATDRLAEVQDKAEKTRKMLDENKFYLEYGAYAKFRKKIRKAE